MRGTGLMGGGASVVERSRGGKVGTQRDHSTRAAVRSERARHDHRVTKSVIAIAVGLLLALIAPLAFAQAAPRAQNLAAVDPTSIGPVARAHAVAVPA